LIRAVVDTNILIRALIKPDGSVGPVLTHLRNGDYLLLYADPLLDELTAKLVLPRIRDKYHLSDEDVETVLALILLRGEPVAPQRRIAVCRDPKDDVVLEVAVAGQADFIVTGDDDLLTLHPFEGIPIVGPAEFLVALEAASDMPSR
jgi:putative PIN family toxin of toxin-antitoxin system